MNVLYFMRLWRCFWCRQGARSWRSAPGNLGVAGHGHPARFTGGDPGVGISRRGVHPVRAGTNPAACLFGVWGWCWVGLPLC